MKPNNEKPDVFQRMADSLFGGNRKLTMGLFVLGLFTIPILPIAALLIYGILPAKREFDAQQRAQNVRGQAQMGKQRAEARTAARSEHPQPPRPRPAGPEIPVPKYTGNHTADELLKATYTFRRQAQPLLPEIDDLQVRAKANAICQKVQSIADWIQGNPATAANAGRLASYYLPTTLKLLQTYTSVDNSPGPNAQAICQQIDGTLVTLNQALDNMQDNLLGNTALDVEAEISAMEQMLGSEGLTDDMRMPFPHSGQGNV